MVSPSKSPFPNRSNLLIELVRAIRFANALLLFSDCVVEGLLQWVLDESWEAEKTFLECNLETNKSWAATNNLIIKIVLSFVDLLMGGVKISGLIRAESFPQN